jgi:3-oxoacyl-[acyl-carrier-protein] synthase-3
MNFKFQRKRISGILTVLPTQEISFIEEMKNYNFPEESSRKLMEVMGYNKRRVAPPGVCLSDLAVFGLQHLFQRGLLAPEEIDALLVISNSHDYIVPPTSNVIQGRLCLKQSMLCLDLNQACAGYVIGLLQALPLLDQESIRKVVIINGDLLSRRTSPKDRSIYPLIGDALTVTVIERDPADSVIHAEVRMDGSRHEALIIPAGGMRQPCSAETAVMEDVGGHNFRAANHLRMDGAAVFNFVQTEIPPLIETVLCTAGVSVADVDYFLCHQPNRFMLEKLAAAMNIPQAKMPCNVVEHFGNSSGATLPIAATLNLSEELSHGNALTCLVGYGAGLTWAAMLMRLGDLSFCEMVEFP